MMPVCLIMGEADHSLLVKVVSTGVLPGKVSIFLSNLSISWGDSLQLCNYSISLQISAYES